MKKLNSFCQVLLVVLLINLSVFAKLHATDYTISFTASGAATTISSVEVQNLTQNTSVVVPAGAPVTLTVSTASPYLKANSLNLKIYPNPITEKSIVSFYSEFGGKTDIAVYGMDGRTIIRTTKNLEAGTNLFKLSLPQGVFTLQINENGMLHIGTVISQTMNKAELEFSGTEPAASKPIQKVKSSATALAYTTGDQLLFKGYSGDYCTIVTLKATSDTTVNFKFVDCTDADGNHYAVVRIGNQTWMAENLKTTRYRNGDAIGTTTGSIPNDATSKYQWAYNGDENNVAKYGRLYTWYAATDSRNIAPAGWHVPTDAEWTILENYLIANEYNYDGTTTGNKIAKALAATTDWNTYNGSGTIGNDLTKNNSSGFTALPGGYRYDYGSFATFGSDGTWWSSTEYGTSYAWYRFLYCGYYFLGRSFSTKSYGFSVRCVSGETPTLTTTAVSSEIWDFAVSGGNITNDGGSAVTARGVCWSLNPNPTINDSISMSGNGIGSFSSLATNLIADTTYYLRAYATNSVGTGYGNTVTFRTLNADLLRGCIEAYPNETGVKDSAYLNGELVNCTKINGKYIYQGDIILEDPTTMNGARRKAAGINELSKRWPYNTVYYTINSNFKNTDRIYNAIKEYHDKTNLKFVQRTNENNYIEFIYDKEGCFSNIGMIGNKQDIAIADWGATKEVIHEIGHAIGLLHEQSKAGRDDFVTIIWDNIVNDKRHNFLEDKNSINTPGFDYNSIMLYDSWGFSKFIKTNSKGENYLSPTDNTTATILKKDGTTFETEDNKHLSESDITLINSLYPPVNKETVTDIDGNVYHTVTIGTQTWMVENLKTTRYRNGKTISNVTDNSTWGGLTTGAWCNYNNNETLDTKYGKLYNWYAVADASNIAPIGWHVATDAEWTTLQSYLIDNGYNYNGIKTENKIGKSLAASTDWNTYTGTGTIGNDLLLNNKTGFTALPGGCRYGIGEFNSIGGNGYWWTSTENYTTNAWYRNLNYDNYFLNAYYLTKSYGFSVRCVKNTEADIPTISTNAISNITSSSAISGGNVTSDGGATVTERGICWNTTGSPTITDSKTSDGTGPGAFASTMTGLTAGTTYYVRAYAINSIGTSYGNVVSFTTGADNTGTTVTDIDGNVYHTVTIGTQTWMVENLKTTRYRNGDPILTTTGSIPNDATSKYHWAYGGNEANVAKYGRLYTWYAATDSRGIAPVGWHVPTDAEWTTLQNYLIANGYNYDGTTTGNKIAKALAATTDWNTYTGTGTIGNDLTKNNSSGFTALPGGDRTSNGSFFSIGDYGLWWSSTEYYTSNAWSRILFYINHYLYRYGGTKSSGFSVRCLRDL